MYVRMNIELEQATQMIATLIIHTLAIVIMKSVQLSLSMKHFVQYSLCVVSVIIPRTHTKQVVDMSYTAIIHIKLQLCVRLSVRYRRLVETTAKHKMQYLWLPMVRGRFLCVSTIVLATDTNTNVLDGLYKNQATMGIYIQWSTDSLIHDCPSDHHGGSRF